MHVSVNGQPVEHAAKPGSYVTIQRAWKDGDAVDVQLPMSLRTEPMPDNPNRVAVCYGPVVLAGELGTDGIVPPLPYAKSQGDFFRAKMPPMPVFVTNGRPVSDWVEAVPGQPLTFRTKGVGRPGDVTLVAFYALPPQRYSIYWDLLTPEQWQEREAAGRRRRTPRAGVECADHRRRPHRRRRLGTVHGLQGERTGAGAFQGQRGAMPTKAVGSRTN